jgi:glycosyltransferase involved in cell wall biosynthesis
MRIALVAPPWLTVPPGSYGGTESVVDALACGLREAGHEVVLLAHESSTCPVERVALPAPEHGAVMGDTMHESRHALLAHAWLAAARARRTIDVVHDHTILGPLLATTHHDLPVVTTNHGPFDDLTRPVYRAMSARVPVIAISHAQAATAGEVPITAVVHHGLDARTFPVGRGERGHIAFVGRMSPTKGVHDAIRLARRAGERLVIAAKMRDHAEYQYFHDVVEPLLDEDAVYIGEVDSTRKAELLGGARVLLNPIHWPEPFGLVMLESLACGTPVVAFDAGAVSEIVEHGRTGFVCRTDAEIVEGLRAVGTIDRAACRAAAAERFSVERMVEGHLAVYRDVIARHR